MIDFSQLPPIKALIREVYRRGRRREESITRVLIPCAVDRGSCANETVRGPGKDRVLVIWG